MADSSAEVRRLVVVRQCQQSLQERLLASSRSFVADISAKMAPGTHNAVADLLLSYQLT